MLILILLMGICLGLGGYTFYYARGFSYLSNNPKACANCHVMQEQYDSWQKSSHHNVAVCNDCHAPHDFLGKYMTKAKNGFRHSLAFTLENFHEPIMIREKNAIILNGTCKSCHEGLMSMIAGHEKSAEDEFFCTRCHAGVGHGQK